MHHALQLQEVLLNIFDLCGLSNTKIARSDISTLARTCHAFKEPALDVLWKNLVDPSPLARCLPEACHSIDKSGGKCYSFSRSLTRAECDILQSYTRRIRSMKDHDRRLDWKSVTTFLPPPTTQSLFPNLRRLSVRSPPEIMSYTPFPSLVSLYVSSMDGNALQGCLESVAEFSPDLRRITVRPFLRDITFNVFFSSWVCRWKNLQTVVCPDTILDADALVHLSRMPTLTWIHFLLDDALPDHITPSDSLPFPSLRSLDLRSNFLSTVSRLLSGTRFLAMTAVTIFIVNHPSRQDLSSFLTSLQKSAMEHIIERFRIHQSYHFEQRSEFGLDLEALRACMAFSNLRGMDLSIGWTVRLTANDLLTLASAWPHLEYLLINEGRGWNTPGGITPDGLLRLLQMCPSLNRIAVAIDTRGYTELPRSLEGIEVGSTLQRKLSIDVLDSVIEAESVPAIAAFFIGLAPFSLFEYWRCRGVEGGTVFWDRWDDVWNQIEHAVNQRFRTSAALTWSRIA